jgi:hypothetical protein
MLWNWSTESKVGDKYFKEKWGGGWEGRGGEFIDGFHLVIK